MDAEAAASLMTTAAAPGGLVVEDFTVKYGKFTAVDLVRLAVGPATVTALLGLNGAGKSSLLRGLMGLVPSQGAVTLSGTADDRGSHIRSRRGLALISEGRGFFPSLSVEHNVVAGVQSLSEKAAVLDDVFGLFPTSSCWMRSAERERCRDRRGRA